MKPIPTLQEIFTSLSGSLRSNLDVQDETLKKTLDAIAASMAAQFYTQYLYLADIQRNLFPDTAESISTGGTLERLGQIYLNRNRNSATQGIYLASVEGEAGAILRENVTFKSDNNSRNPNSLFILDNQYTLIGVDDVITIRATQGGLESLLDIGNGLTVTEPVVNVSRNITITEIVEMPLAEESEEVYRQAVLDSIQLEPQGGARTDYRIWSSDASGVRRVYPYAKDGQASTVQVFVEATVENSPNGDGVPSQVVLDNVSEVIELDPDATKPINERGRRPLQAQVEVLAVNTANVGIVIEGLDDNSPSVISQIRNVIIQELFGVRPFIAGGELLINKNDNLLSGRINSQIQLAIGSNFFTNLTMSVDGNNVISELFTLGRIPFLTSLIINGETITL